MFGYLHIDKNGSNRNLLNLMLTFPSYSKVVCNGTTKRRKYAFKNS